MVGTLSSNLIQLTSSTFFRMVTHHATPARGSGRPHLTGTARQRAGAKIRRLRRIYGNKRRNIRHQALLRKRAAQAALVLAVAFATTAILHLTQAPASATAPAAAQRRNSNYTAHMAPAGAAANSTPASGTDSH